MCAQTQLSSPFLRSSNPLRREARIALRGMLCRGCSTLAGPSMRRTMCSLLRALEGWRAARRCSSRLAQWGQQALPDRHPSTLSPHPLQIAADAPEGAATTTRVLRCHISSIRQIITAPRTSSRRAAADQSSVDPSIRPGGSQTRPAITAVAAGAAAQDASVWRRQHPPQTPRSGGAPAGRPTPPH